MKKQHSWNSQDTVFWRLGFFPRMLLGQNTSFCGAEVSGSDRGDDLSAVMSAEGSRSVCPGIASLHGSSHSCGSWG